MDPAYSSTTESPGSNESSDFSDASEVRKASNAKGDVEEGGAQTEGVRTQSAVTSSSLGVAYTAKTESTKDKHGIVLPCPPSDEEKVSTEHYKAVSKDVFFSFRYKFMEKEPVPDHVIPPNSPQQVEI